MATLYKYLAQGGREVAWLDSDDTYNSDAGHDAVRASWAEHYPELANATTNIDEKPQTVTFEEQRVDVDRVVEFSKRTGVKGSWPMYLVNGMATNGQRVKAVHAELRAPSKAQAAAAALAELPADYEWSGDPFVTEVPEAMLLWRSGQQPLQGFEDARPVGV